MAGGRMPSAAANANLGLWSEEFLRLSSSERHQLIVKSAV
jgi:hypothetical protein